MPIKLVNAVLVVSSGSKRRGASWADLREMCKFCQRCGKEPAREAKLKVKYEVGRPGRQAGICT